MSSDELLQLKLRIFELESLFREALQKKDFNCMIKYSIELNQIQKKLKKAKRVIDKNVNKEM